MGTLPQALFFLQKNGPHMFTSPELVGTLPRVADESVFKVLRIRFKVLTYPFCWHTYPFYSVTDPFLRFLYPFYSVTYPFCGLTYPFLMSRIRS